MIVISIQFLLFTFYLLYIWTRYGVLNSISDSWYTVDKGKKWMFTIIFCFSVGFLHVFHSAIHSLFFFSGSFLCFTGAAAAFKDGKMTKFVHYIGAVGAIIFSVLALYLLGIKWVLGINFIFMIISFFIKNKLWWIEVVAVYTILGGLLQYYLT